MHKKKEMQMHLLLYINIYYKFRPPFLHALL